jgi:DNA polymerase-3 subunit delta
MNFSLFVGSTVDPGSIIEMAQSYPFMAEKRVILVENSKAFSSDNSSLAECILNLPETTYIIFTELDVQKKKGRSKKKDDDDSEAETQSKTETAEEDTTESSTEKSSKKKIRLFDAVKEVGHIAEIKEQPKPAIENWIVKYCNEAGKRISRAALDTLLARTGLDMMRINNEMDKIIAYKGDEQDIKAEDVIALVSEDPKEQVFKLVDGMADRKVDQAMHYYIDMLELKISPQNILRLIERQMRILYQVKDLRSKGFGTNAIAEKVKDIKNSYFINKYVSQASKFSMQEINDCLEDCVDLNLKSRTGALTDRMAVELIIVKYSQNPSRR